MGQLPKWYTRTLRFGDHCGTEIDSDHLANRADQVGDLA
jgi:hypothetical protein